MGQAQIRTKFYSERNLTQNVTVSFFTCRKLYGESFLHVIITTLMFNCIYTSKKYLYYIKQQLFFEHCDA